MTQEEKAKAYEEIIKKANKMHSENCEACKACIEELIPELAENEDKTEKQGEQKASYITMVETGDGGINALVTRELSTDDVDKIVGMDLEDYL